MSVLACVCCSGFDRKGRQEGGKEVKQRRVWWRGRAVSQTLICRRKRWTLRCDDDFKAAFEEDDDDDVDDDDSHHGDVEFDDDDDAEMSEEDPHSDLADDDG